MTADLWRSKAEGGSVDVSLVPIDQMQAFLLCKTQVPPCGHVAESERLPPACMPTTPTEEYQEHCVFCCFVFLWRKLNSPQHLVCPAYCWNGRGASRGHTTLIPFWASDIKYGSSNSVHPLWAKTAETEILGPALAVTSSSVCNMILLYCVYVCFIFFFLQMFLQMRL